MSRMNIQQKAEFVGDIFCIRRFWGGHGKFSQKKLFYARRYDLPEMLIQRPVEFLTAVTRKSRTVWSHLMDHRKAERVVIQYSIRDFWRFGQSEMEN
jgi:hypothetical protein